MKNIELRVLLASTLVLCLFALPLASAVNADDSVSGVGNASDAGMEKVDFKSSQMLKGDAVVKEPLSGQKLKVSINGSDLVLNITEDILAIDSQSGLPASLNSLKAQDAIYVYYSAAMTKSLPPQANAIAVVTGVEPGKTHAELFTVREIVSRGSGEVRALNTEGSLIAAFHKDTIITPYKTKQRVSVEDIHVGTQIFIWYDIVALSYPGQTGATRAVVAGQEEGLGVRAVYTPMMGPQAAKVTIGEKHMAYTDKTPMDHNGLLMLPLRASAEQLGYQLAWDAATKSIHMDNGIVNTTLRIGEDSYYKASSQAIGLTQPFGLGASPVLTEGSTYVPASLFNLLLSDNEAVRIEVLSK